jgi:hypothetical protein
MQDHLAGLRVKLAGEGEALAVNDADIGDTVT